MDIKSSSNLVRLLLSIADKKSATNTVIETPPQKVLLTPERKADGETDLPVTLPEAVGVNSGRIKAYFDALTKDGTVFPHSVLIAKGGFEIGRKEWEPYSASRWHISYSMAKTIVGIAVGFLLREERITLDTRVFKIFEKKLPLTVNFKMYALTVRNLMTMQSGVNFNEAGSVSSSNWISSFLSSQISFEPGKGFNYNSMNTYMLSAIVREVTGEGLVEYLTPRLFDPLGIKRIFWEKSPDGVEKGGWGLFILPKDMLKLGVLFAQRGMWGGERIVLPEWIDEMSAKQAEVPENVSRYDYGYQMWHSDEPEQCVFNGLFGQNINIFKKSGIVVASTAGNCDMFHTNNFFRITEEFWGYSEKLCDEEQKLPDGLQVYDRTERFYTGKPFDGEGYPEKLNAFVGAVYTVRSRKAKNTGVLPLFMQMTQNNYTSGVEKIGFAVKDGIFTVDFTEGEEKFGIPVCFGRNKDSVFRFGGEIYSIATEGVLTENEDGVPCLKIRISFTETASVRYIKFFFYEREIRTYWNETPGALFLDKGLVSVLAGFRKNKLFGGVAGKVDVEYFSEQFRKLFESEADGVMENGGEPRRFAGSSREELYNQDAFPELLNGD